MGNIDCDAFRYSETIVIVFGIIGNIWVILSILKQKIVLKNNYYFLVLHLAICDLIVLIVHFFDMVKHLWLKDSFSVHFHMIICHILVITNAFQFAGIGMMLIISLLRYRAIVHPLKPAISRRKLKVACGLVYLVGLITACGIRLPLCYIKSNVVISVYWKMFQAFWVFFVSAVATILMTVVYYKIAKALITQNNYIKRVCLDATRQRAPDSSFNVLRNIRNRRTFLVCLSIVLCYGIGSIPISVLFIRFITYDEDHLELKDGWVWHFAHVIKLISSHSINPLIYGMLDKKIVAFSKLCRKRGGQKN